MREAIAVVRSLIPTKQSHLQGRHKLNSASCSVTAAVAGRQHRQTLSAGPGRGGSATAPLCSQLYVCADQRVTDEASAFLPSGTFWHVWVVANNRCGPPAKWHGQVPVPHSTASAHSALYLLFCSLLAPDPAEHPFPPFVQNYKSHDAPLLFGTESTEKEGQSTMVDVEMSEVSYLQPIRIPI